MKFVIITDSHIGPCAFYKGTNRIMSNMSEVVLQQLVELVNSEEGVSFVAQLGDMSQDDVRFPNVEFDRANFKRALWYFSRFNMPVHHAVGNHDRENLEYKDLCSLLGYSTLHYSFDREGYHCVFLYTRHFNHRDMVIESDQLLWLKEDLAKTRLPSLVFMHHPVSDQDLSGNFWFSETPEKALVKNRLEVREIFEQSGKVIGVFNGHLHSNAMTVHRGIPYFTIQSCVEDVAMNGEPSRTYAVVGVNSGVLSVEIRGEDPGFFSYGG